MLGGAMGKPDGMPCQGSCKNECLSQCCYEGKCEPQSKCFKDTAEMQRICKNGSDALYEQAGYLNTKCRVGGGCEPPLVCEGGWCRMPKNVVQDWQKAPPCPGMSDRETCCNGVAKDLNSDPTNCGKCGRKCAKGLVCLRGACVELDVANDKFNCGSPGIRCQDLQKCVAGKCENDVPVEPGLIECKAGECKRGLPPAPPGVKVAKDLAGKGCNIL